MNIEHLKLNIGCRAMREKRKPIRNLQCSIFNLQSWMAIGLMALASAVQAANPPASLTMIPPQINYQGRLTTPANVPYNDTTHTIDLVLYPTASGGTRIWGERYAVQTRDGYFSVNLGSGGTPIPGVTNPPIYQVLWKADAASPDNFFMALTVRTDPSGAAIPSPLEATPRQQFLTAPFAYRAHQSVYATKADGLFSAAQGVQTPTLTNTTQISVGAPTRVDVVSTRVNFASPNFEVNGRPMFVSTAGSASGATRTFTVASGIDTTFYQVVIAGWTCSTTAPAIQSVYINPFAPANAGVTFATTPASSVTVTVTFLGIAKGAF